MFSLCKNVKILNKIAQKASWREWFKIGCLYVNILPNADFTEIKIFIIDV